MSDFPALPYAGYGGQIVAKIPYRIVAEVPGGYAVEVKDHGSLVHFESGFAAEGEAETWAADQAKATRGIDQWSAELTDLEGADRCQ